MLVTMGTLLSEAAKGGFAVGAFNFSTLESGRAAIEAAERTGCPFILQHAPAHEKYVPLDMAAPIMLRLAKSAKVPVAVHLDHGTDFALCRHALELGFTSVMIDASSKPFEENIALTPYSALASGRLSRLPGEGGTKRAEEDAYAKFKYDATAVQDNVIIARVAELAEKRGVTMTEISLAWLLSTVTSPVVGATKLHHIEGAAKAVDLELTDGETAYLEEPYMPHPLAGVMAQNKPAAAKEKHVWSTGDQKIGK